MDQNVSLGNTGFDSPKAIKTPLVDQSFRKLFESIASLNENVGRLEHRLNSVLSPVTNGADPVTPENRPPPMRVSENIELSVGAIKQINKKVNFLLESLEI